MKHAKLFLASGDVNCTIQRPAEDGLPEVVRLAESDEDLQICISSDEEGGEVETGIEDEGVSPLFPLRTGMSLRRGIIN